MNESASASPLPQNIEEEESALSLEAVFTAIRRFWFLIILCAALGGAGAYYFAGQQNYVYKKTASVMMKDGGKQSASTDRILTELGADPGAANLANESYILRSTALMQRVVDKLKLNTTYWQRQNLRQVELYTATPLVVRFESIDANRSCSMDITPLDATTYHLTYTNSAQQPVVLKGSFGEPLELPFATISVHPTSNMAPETSGRTISVQRTSALATTRDLLASLSVTRPDQKDASMLEMTLTATNPEKAEDVLNELIVAYNENSKEEKSESARKTDAFIRSRLEEIGSALTEVDKQISDSKESANVMRDTEAAFTADFSNTQAIRQQIEQLETQQKLAATLHTNLNECEREGTLLTVNTGVSDSAIASKVEAYNEAYLEYSKISRSAGAKNPIAVALREQMSATRQAVRKALANYENTLTLQLRDHRERLEALRASMAETVSAEKALAPLIREHKVKEELYMLLLTKEQENALALAIAAPGAKVLETAYGSNAPIAPRTMVFIAAGTVGGGAVCLLLILGIGMLDNKVNTKHDLAAYTRQPVVAELPVLSRKEKRAHRIFVKDAHSTMAECLHILRNNVDNLLPRPEKGGHIILLTSTMPNEGKTLVSANLAATFAQAGRRVLLIDADLRKTSLTRDLGGKGRKGLTNILLNHVQNPAEVIHTLTEVTPDAGVEHAGVAQVLYAGTGVPNPVTLLTTERFGSLLRELAGQYDAVIVDAPPQGILADTDIIARHADITLYLIRAGQVVRKYFTQVQKLADEGKLPNLAYVLNAVDFRAHSYNYYGYGYAYGYYRYGYSANSSRRSGKAAAAEGKKENPANS